MPCPLLRYQDPVFPRSTDVGLTVVMTVAPSKADESENEVQGESAVEVEVDRDSLDESSR